MESSYYKSSSSTTYSGPQYGSLSSMRINSNYNVVRKQLAKNNVDETESLLLPIDGELSTDAESSSSKNATASSAAALVTTTHRTFFRKLSGHVFPARWDIIEGGVGASDMDINVLWNSNTRNNVTDDPPYNNNERQQQQQRKIISSRFQQSKETAKVHRSLTRRIYLILSEPDTSIASAIFFFILVITITLMNIIMVLQTMDRFQFTPTDCRACGGSIPYAFDDDGTSIKSMTDAALNNVECVCPPTPLHWTVTCLDHLVYFFTIEWSLRFLTFTPAPDERAATVIGRLGQWLGFLTSPSMVLDGLATFPYYFEILGGVSNNGLMPLRLLRLFRVFQLVRLGQYNASFTSLTRVMVQSMVYLKLLAVALIFGALFFGSLMYWLERGEWQYWPATEKWEFVRESHHQGSGLYELSPYTSIPQTFWWFLVTATTVGYGDQYPTSTAGKWVATGAMLMGVLVIAFPVSVFSDLWSKELRRSGALASLLDGDEDDGDNDNGDNDNQKTAQDSVTCNNIDGNEQPPLYKGDASSKAAQFFSSGPSSMSSAAPFSMSQTWSGVDPCNRGDFNAGGDTVVLEKNDLAEIVVQLQSIQDSQRQIRHILRKYKIQFD